MENSIDSLFDQDSEDKISKYLENEEESVELKQTIHNFSSTLPMKKSKREEGKNVFIDENENEEMKSKQHINSQANADFESKRIKNSNFSTQKIGLKINENENNQQKTKNKKIQSQFSKKTQKEYKFSSGRDIQMERQIEGVKKQINNNVYALQKLMEDKITKNANKLKMNESFSKSTNFSIKSKNVDYSVNKQKIISRTAEDKKQKEGNQKMKNKTEVVPKKQQSGKILAKLNDKKAITDVEKLKNKYKLNNNDKENRKKHVNKEVKVNLLELKETKKKENHLKQKKTKIEHKKSNESIQEEKDNDKSLHILADVSQECKITSIQEETNKSNSFQKTQKNLIKKVEDHISIQNKQQDEDLNNNLSTISKTDDHKSDFYQKTMIGLVEKTLLYLNSKTKSEHKIINESIKEEKDNDKNFQNLVDVSQECKITSIQEETKEIEAKRPDHYQKTHKDLIKKVEDHISIQNKQKDIVQSQNSAFSKSDEDKLNFYQKTMISLIDKIHFYLNSKVISDELVDDKQFEQVEESKMQIEDKEIEIKNENQIAEELVKNQLNEEEIQEPHISLLNKEIKHIQNENLSINNEKQFQQQNTNKPNNNNDDLCNMNTIFQHTNEIHENEMKINSLTNQIKQIQAQISNQDIKQNEKDDEKLECIQNEYTKLQEEKQVLEHNNEKLQEHNLSLQCTNEELQQQIQSIAVKKQENETIIDILRKEIESLQEKIANQNIENRIEIRNENNYYQFLGNNKVDAYQNENDKSFTESSKLYTDSPDELESNNFYSSDELNYYSISESNVLNLSDFKQNFDLYLRCLVKYSDEHPIKYDEIPKEFSDFFSIIGVSQALNISIGNPLPKDLAKIENYIDENQHSFMKFNEVAESIRNNFQSDIEKMYAAYYFITHHVEYDIQKKLSTNREDSSIEKIFDTKKGVCSDYSKLFIEMMKKSGVSSKRIPMVYYVNASKSSNWNSFRPLSYPYFNHAAVLIKINNEYYISEPTWGAGITNKDDEYQVNYRKSYFLIPYFKGVLSHFPKYAYDETLQIPFSWDQFASLNNPNISKELAFESNPFQKITVNDGFYDFQFSFVQPVDSLSAKIYLLDENVWQEQRENLISFECIEKNLPNHCFSFYPTELRCRYKMRASFIETGTYRVETYLNLKLLFIVYFDVKSISNIKLGIPGCFKEKNGFEPIAPIDGLTKVTNGYARIRFAVKYKNSKTLISLYKIKENTFTRERKFEDECIDCFTTKLPFMNYDEKESNDDLVENWMLIKFPENGRWEVEIYFQTEKLLMFQYGVKYYFDVEGSGKYNLSPLFDFPNNRKFAAFDMSIPMKVSINPQTNAVVLNDYDYNFHVLSEENVNVYIKSDNKSNSEYSSDLLSLFSEKKDDETNLTDYEYSITFPKSDKYNLIIVYDGKIIGSQNFYVIDEELPEETEEERLLMENLKNKLDGKIDYYKDIPISIRKNVEKMLKRSNNE